jgi:two-component system sensor histidine kinase MprB
MTFRRRIVVLAAGAVAAAIALAAIVTYVVVRHELGGGVDASLRQQRPRVVLFSRNGKDTGGAVGQSVTAPAPGQSVSGAQFGQLPAGADEVFEAQLPSTSLGGSAGVVQVTLSNGDVIRSASGASLPTTAAVRDVASGKRPEALRDETVRGVGYVLRAPRP